MAVSALLLIAAAVFLLLAVVAGVVLAVYMARRQRPDASEDAALDPFGQPWEGTSASYGHGTPDAYPGATAYGEVQPAASPREFGSTGGFRRVADQSASVGAPGSDDAPGAPRYGYAEPEPPLPYPTDASEATGADALGDPATDGRDLDPAPAAEETSASSVDPFALHAPSDDIEQTIRISRTSGEPQLAGPQTSEPADTSWADAISIEEPEPVVEETVRRSDLTFMDAPAEDLTGDAATSTDTLGEEHTYWDDEEEEQARHAESLVEAEEVVDGGYGWGSAAPFADGSMPPGHPVKGHREWMQYHEPGSPWYDETTVDVWFTDAAAAERAGFHRA